MARPKIPRKSTTVDMTAMCDVAFLLLSFFILATKFKPSDAIPINTPKSVAAKIAPEKNLVMVSMDKDGKVYLSVGDGTEDKDNFEQIVRSVNTSKSLGLSDADISAIKAQNVIGVPIAQLAQQAKLPKEKLNSQVLPGIPCKDSTSNEMITWMRAVSDVYAGQTPPNLLLKGDNLAKYPSFKNILAAFKKNDFFKFQMVTNQEQVPEGSELWKLPHRTDE